MGVQGADGALDGAVDQVFAGLGLGILIFHQGQGLGKYLQTRLDARDGRVSPRRDFLQRGR